MNNYHIYEEIGRGKYSVVYKGRKKKSIEYMAVKSLEKSRRNKVLNEVKIFHSLNHPNIMRFYNWYETRNHLWVIFEYCPGGDLQTLIEQDKKLPEQLVKSFSKDLAAGLQYLHSKGIIYCDLKPSNILLNEFGQLKICDFGLSRRIIDMITADEGKETVKKGSPCYMAPELFQDDGVYSFQADFWALGCVMYELATGKPPFVSKSFQDLVDQILNQEVQKVSGFSNEFNDLIEKLLQKNPIKRITWDSLILHPFWSGLQKLQQTDIPQQPHFDQWLANYNKQIGALTSQQQQYQVLQNQQNPSSQTPKNVNVMRLSLNIQKNLKKELSDQYVVVTKDVELNNRNQTINMGGRDDEEDEEQDYENNNGYNIQNAEEDNKRNIDIDSQFHSKQPVDTPIHDARNKNQYNQNQVANAGLSQNLVPVNELFTHLSDNAVKPIIGNKEIEKTATESFKKEQLPFQCFMADEVQQGIESPSIETHFENIFNSLVQAHTDKFNILCYFETIVQNSQVANRLINSAFMNLLLKLLKTVKQTQTKIKIGSILGLLIRHATVIDNELSQQGIPQILIETVKIEKSEKVKRRCMAALGEYLFYGATQMDEDPTNSCWQIQGFVLQFLIKVLKSENEDELVKYYACKTIENITAQSVETGQQFANPETCLAMAGLYLSSTNEGLKQSAMISLQHMTMLNNSLTDVVLNSLGKVQGIKDILRDGSNRVQQALLTITNLQILISETELTQSLLNDLQFIESITHLLDNQSLVVRGKVILTIFLIIKVNTKALVLLAQTKFFTALEKISRDSQTYVQQCFANLKLHLEEMIGIILQVILDEVTRISRGEVANNNNTSAYYQQNQEYSSVVPTLTGNLQYLQVLLQYANCNQLNQSLFQLNYLQTLFQLLNFAKDLQTEVKSVLINLYEVLLTNTKAVHQNSDYFLNNVVPKLLEQLKAQIDQSNKENKNTDMKFNYLKLLNDILSPFFNADTNGSSQINRMHDYFTKAFVNELLVQLLIPSESEQVQMMALKLFNLLVESQPKHYINIIKQNMIIGNIIQQFTLNPSRITLKLIAKVTQCSTLQEISSYKIAQESVKLFTNHIAKQQDSAEDLVDIFLNITTKLVGGLNLDKPILNDQRVDNIYDYLLQAYDIGFSLLNSIDFSLSEKIGMFIIHIIYLYGKQDSHKIFKQDYILSIIQTINQYHMVNTMMRRNTRVLNWIIQLIPQARDLKESIIFALDRLKNTDDSKISVNISEIKIALSK
ncbi:Serine/Threonine kinase domain protein (macronuclear) [Tetrahymena thermophila SB210]|uniref:Serine/Threonine kinase domain protein n=1 Tax=Tetrahymena thermophila (strain SB210) TaxID=312017 RepID=Q24GE3_TETTS|nr:Serine/Threonine kinase domain protein [Tetrahymena thermophila SB210]EAS06928.2 Serine/Threonine kinase domain protein [Tetrahymena thermophila SB210]|eukprot:XP_001027170.2 Serine/Threonine kinase domain protein [Tetrahymena thermophila SB210]